MPRYLITGNMAGDIKHLDTILFDQENSVVRFLANENRLEIAEGHVHVVLGGLLGFGPDDRKIAKIYANTAAHYKRVGKHRLFMLCGNRENISDRLATELNNKHIKDSIINNDSDPRDPSKMSFAEYLVALLYWQQEHRRTVTFLDSSKVHAIKNAANIGQELINRLRKLATKENRSREEDEELDAKKLEFFAQIKYKISGNKPGKIRLRKLIWRLVSKCMHIEGSGLEKDGQDYKGNYDNILLIYLWWILPANVFEQRRAELAREESKDVTDAQVMECMIVDAIMPSGHYRKIAESSLAIMRIDDTLFVPGGLNSESLVVCAVDYSDKPINAWIAAVNKQFKNEQKWRYSGDLRAKRFLEKDISGSTNANFGSCLEDAIIKFLKKNNINRILIGRKQNPLTILGTQFIQDGVVVACLDFDRSDTTKQAMCYATWDDISFQIRTHVHMPHPQAITIQEILEPLEIRDNELGFDCGEYTRVITTAKDMLLAKGSLVELVPKDLLPELGGFSRLALSV